MATLPTKAYLTVNASLSKPEVATTNMASQQPPTSLVTDQPQPDHVYDPACDVGILFDTCAMLDKVDKANMCRECTKHMCQLIDTACQNRLMNEDGLLIRGSSQIFHVSRNELTGKLEFTTTINPDPVPIDEFVPVKAYCYAAGISKPYEPPIEEQPANEPQIAESPANEASVDSPNEPPFNEALVNESTVSEPAAEESSATSQPKEPPRRSAAEEDAGSRTPAECAIDTLYDPGSDAWDLDQCKLWYVLEGRYMIEDAVRGRSIADFARNHMLLLDRICKYPPPTQCRGRCFPDPHPVYKIADRGVADVAQRTALALESALHYMDPRVRALVEDQLVRPHEWPEPLRSERDQIRLLAGIEEMPAFRARLFYLRHQPDYKSREENCREWIRRWREGKQHRAHLLATLPQRYPSVLAIISSWMVQGDNHRELVKQLDIVEEAIDCVVAAHII